MKLQENDRSIIPQSETLNSSVGNPWVHVHFRTQSLLNFRKVRQCMCTVLYVPSLADTGQETREHFFSKTCEYLHEVG